MDKHALYQYIDGKAADFCRVSDTVWDAAETAFEEKISAEALCQALEQEGFAVERGVAGIETAFLGRFGSGKPVIGFLGEFDALSGLSQKAGVCRPEPITPGENGHGCGHNRLGVASLAAAAAVKQYLEQTGAPGTVIYFGTPGEEGGSGKAFMAREGVFDELDLALTWHPGFHNSVSSGSSLANYQVRYVFSGVSAHAAGNPHQGRSALDAVELMNIGVQFLREHIIQEARIHYAITNTGGFSPNVVQAHAEVLYLIRAPKTPQVEEIYQRVNKIAQGAALMTETELTIDFVKACSNVIPNNALERVLYQNMRELPPPQYTDEEMAFIRAIAETCKPDLDALRRKMRGAPEDEIAAVEGQLQKPIYDFVLPYAPDASSMSGSTDVGDVSWVCPTAQIYTATWAAGTPGHSWQIVAQGKSAQAHKGMLYAGKVMAGAAVDLLQNPDLVQKAKDEHARRMGGAKYVCPIPAGVKPRKMR